MQLKVITSLYLHLFTSAFAYKLAIKSGWMIVLGFFLLAHVGVSVLAVSELYARSLPQTISDSRLTVTKSREFIPNDTQINWDSGTQQLSFTQVELPIRIPTDIYSGISLFEIETVTNLPKYAVIIPDDAESKEQSLLTVLPDGISVQGTTMSDSTKLPFNTLPQFNDSFSVDGEYMFAYFSQMIDKIESSFYMYWPVILFLALPITITLTALNLILDTFFIVLLVKLNSYRMTLGESVQLSLLISGVAALVNQAAIILYPTLNWPFYSVTFWMITAYVLLLNKRLW